MSVPMKTPVQSDIMESVIVKGDLAKLTSDERVRYYGEVCRSLGLNPLTKPFEFIILNGKLQLYALRACTDQLRKINSVSLEVVSKEIVHDLLTIHVRARLPDGRVDEDFGSVPFADTLRGEARANAELKAVTKAKRRATLSICGLGWLDETEVESILPHAKRPAPPAPNVMLPLHDEATGEIIESVGSSAEAAPADVPQSSAARAAEIEERPFGRPYSTSCTAVMPTPSPADVPQSSPARAAEISDERFGMAQAAAMRGRDALVEFAKACTSTERKALAAQKAELEMLYPKEIAQ